MNTNEKICDAEFVTETAMGWVTFSYLWRMLLILGVILFALFWFLYPYMQILALVLACLATVVVIFEGVRRILRCRAKLIFGRNSLQINDYCGSSFRMDGMMRKDFLTVQNPGERYVNTGRLLIRKKGIYLRGVSHFKEMCAYIDAMNYSGGDESAK